MTLSDDNAPHFELVEEPVAAPADDASVPEDDEDDRDGQED